MALEVGGICFVLTCFPIFPEVSTSEALVTLAVTALSKVS
jgi:hypothetical protein